MKPSYLHRLTLRQLEIFLAVCRLRSYSGAADELALTQPAVSAQVRQLEQLVGEPLLDYVGRRVYLTPAGELLERAGREMQQRLVTVEMELAQLHGVMQGALGIAIESSAQYFMPALVADFCARHPAVEVRLEVVSSAGALRRIAERREELAVVTAAPADRTLAFIPFRENRLLAVAAPDHPLAARESVTLLELAAETLLLRELGSGTRRILEQHLQAQGVRSSRSRQLGSLEAVKAGVLAGLGVAAIPLDCCRGELARGQLVSLPVEGFPLRRSRCALHLSGRHLTPVGRRFLEHLVGGQAGAGNERINASLPEVVEPGRAECL